MSKIVATAAIRGAHNLVSEAKQFLDKAIKEKGLDVEIGFPETAFYLPFYYALFAVEVKTLNDAVKVLEHAQSLLPSEPSQNLWLPYLGITLDAGIASLLAEEIIMVLRYLYKQEPQADCNGFFSDTAMRSLGIQLVDGRMPGFAAILGAAPDNKTAVGIVRELQQRNILTFVGSSSNGHSIIDQLKEENVEMGWDTYIVPYGRDTQSGIYALNWAIRSAITFGGIKPGQTKKCLLYTKNRVFAFGLALGPLDDIKYATGAGAIAMGFPVIADTDIPEIKPSGVTTYEALVKEFDYKRIVSRCIEVRGVKVKISKIPIPVAYAAAFEGERVRKENLAVEFGGKVSEAFEFLESKESEMIEDGKVELIGPDLDSVKEANKKSMPLGIVVNVYGRKMQKDFEPIMERQIHRYVNGAMGVMHIGQRDMCWIRVSNDAFNKGFRLKHLGLLIHAMLHQEYGAIVDKVQVTLYTKQEDLEKLLIHMKKTFDERDARIMGMTDESVDTFYSCLLCQSFAPNHVCVITPERLGLCGAYSWLDGKASYEITPTGPNQPVTKGKVIDAKFGQWENVNKFVYEKSNKTISKVSMYSIMDNPQTSCVSANTQVIIDNEVIEIGKFVDRFRGSDEFAKSVCLTLNDSKAKVDKIIAMQRFPVPKRKKIILLKTKSGQELFLTPKHRVAVDRPQGIKWIRVSNIKRDDRVLGLKSLRLEELKPDIFDFVPDDFFAKNEKLIKNIKLKLKEKYGTLAVALNRLSINYFRDQAIKISHLKLILKDIGWDWSKIKEDLKIISIGSSTFKLPPNIINRDLFYLMGLIASDGSVFQRGNYEYNIYFINTEKSLINEFCRSYKKIFPDKKLHLSIKTSKKASYIRQKRINSKKDCFVCYISNPLLGVILKYFGITSSNEKRLFKNMLKLPKDYIAAFLSGLMDGDGSLRLRKYSKNKNWQIGEGYICLSGRRNAHYLQLLLKRFGILANVKKSKSVYKVILHGSNLYEFSKVLKLFHKNKARIKIKINSKYSKKFLSKSQSQVLPFSVGKALAKITENKAIFSPTTQVYYKTLRSRPVLGNVRKAMSKLETKHVRQLESLIDSDFYLDKVKSVGAINSNGNIKYVYNLTLADNHHYFANQVLIKNCGCFECILAVIPEANGVMIVHRDFTGMTPVGMSFTTLASSVGGGMQTPGFLGVGKLYVISKKFISADGGLKRMVWMPKELKEILGDRLKKRCQELDESNFFEKIADETIAVTAEDLVRYLQEKDHPALKMPPLL